MKTKILIVATILAFVNLTTNAQEKRFGFEFTAGPSFGTINKIDDEIHAGLGFEALINYNLMPHTGVYAGWGWNRLSVNQSFAGADKDFEETGYILGLQYKHPLGSSPTSYYVRAGGLFNHIEIENMEGEIRSDSGHGWGWQAAGGIDIPVGSDWHLTPGIKFNSLSRSIDYDNNQSQLDLRYFSLRVGFLKKF